MSDNEKRNKSIMTSRMVVMKFVHITSENSHDKISFSISSVYFLNHSISREGFQCLFVFAE